jgi:hypothetical protein
LQACWIDGVTLFQLEELGVHDDGRRSRQQAFERALAFDQRCGAQVVPVEIEQIERVVDQLAGAFLSELPAQRLEIRQAGGSEHGGLAVDDQVTRGERFGGARDRPELLGPVVAAARIDPDPPVVDVHLGAIAVDLDLVQPVGTIGRARPQGRVAGLDESGEGPGSGARNGGRGAAFGQTPQRDGTHGDSIGRGVSVPRLWSREDL